MRRWSIGVLVAIVLLPTTPAQAGSVATWIDRSAWPTGRQAAGSAYDSHRGRIVMFGGVTGAHDYYCGANDTWEWDGSRWTRRYPERSPSTRFQPAMAYDEARRETVLFGGGGAPGFYPGLSDTWVWDGTKWTQREPAHVPPPRYGHVLAYDAARERVVLFGGANVDSRFADTWEWDGTDWTQRTTLVSPGAREEAVMAYDAARQRTVLFGGLKNAPDTTGDTWEWDGEAWTLAPATMPDRIRAAMVYDASRRRLVLFGGITAFVGDVPMDTWEYDGTAWVPVSVGATVTDGGVEFVSPGYRYYHTLAYDGVRRKAVVFGGSNGASTSDMFSWDGSRWTYDGSGRAATLDAGAAYDPARDRLVLHASQPDPFNWAATFTGVTWELDPDGAWTESGYLGAKDHDLVYDPVRRRTVTVVMKNEQDPLEVYEWDGAAWTLRPVDGPRPGPREQFALAYDAGRGRVVLFGGRLYRALADTWEWDGSAWTQLDAPGPSARWGHAMAFDAARGRAVLFGGTDTEGPANVNDTWEWDGSSWTKVAASGPVARVEAAMAYDPSASVVALFGGRPTGTSLADIWTWDGTTWTDVTPAFSPPARSAAAFAYDSGHGRLMLVGGRGRCALEDTWELQLLDS